MKYHLHCTSLGEMDSSVAQAAGATLDHHRWAPSKWQLGKATGSRLIHEEMNARGIEKKGKGESKIMKKLLNE